MIKLFYYSQYCLLLPRQVEGVGATYDESADGTDGGNALARAVVELDLDEVALGLSIV